MELLYHSAERTRQIVTRTFPIVCSESSRCWTSKRTSLCRTPPFCSTHSTASGVSMQLAIHLPSGRRQSSRERQSVDLWKTGGTPCEEEIGRAACREQG